MSSSAASSRPFSFPRSFVAYAAGAANARPVRLTEIVHSRRDGELGNPGSGMQFDQEPYRGTNVFRLENHRPPLGPDWNRPGVEDGRVDLTGIDHGRADAPSALFPAQADSQRRLAELGRRITRTAQGAGPDSGDRADLDDLTRRKPRGFSPWLGGFLRRFEPFPA